MVVCLLVVSTITTLLAIGPAVVLGTSSPASSADFSMAVSPSIVPINPGFWGLLSAVSVGGSGFTGDVSLSAAAPAGFTGSVSISPSTMGLVDGSCYYACVSDLDISSTDSIPVGYYNITITGTSGSLTHSTTMTLIVTIEDFSVMAGSGCGVQCFLTVSQGSAGTFPIQLKSINGFSGNVSLSDSVSYPPTLSASLNPATVSLSSGGSAISTLTVTVSDSTPPGSYPIEITGSSGLLWHGTSLTVVVTLAYFSVSANPTSLEIPLGSQRQTLTTVTWLNGLSNSILLQVASSSAAVSCVFASSNTSGLTVTEPASGSAYQYLKCAANGPVGNYKVTIYGTSGPYQQSTMLQVAVSVDPTISTAVNFQGVTVTASGSLTISSGTVTGTVSVTATNSTTGAVLFSKTYGITVGYGSGSTARFVLTIPTGSSWLGTACTVNVSTNTAACSISRAPDVNHDGVVDLLDLAQAAIAFDSVKGDAGYSASCDLNADGSVNILDLAQLAIDYQLPVFG